MSVSSQSSSVNDSEEKDFQRLVASVEYNGSVFKGWQWQLNASPTVQPTLEKALSFVANHPVSVVCAGRTDAGVHATRQIVHFDVTVERSLHGWKMGANANLPNDICIHWVKPVCRDFHARYKAYERRYRYVIFNSEVKPALFSQQVTWVRKPLDADAMQEASQSLLGTHDFSAFRASGCQAKSAIKTMNHINVRRFGHFVVLEVAASAFLYHMVRNIAGVLIEVGLGDRPVSWCESVLRSGNRKQAGVTAPANGLYFVDVKYPNEFAIPEEPFGPSFVQAFHECVDNNQ